MLASCKNCLHRRADGCGLGRAPAKHDLLCQKYEMSDAFRAEVVDLVRRDVEREVNAAILRVRLDRAEAFAG